LDYHVLVRYLDATHAKTTNSAELNTALLSIWNDLPQEFINKSILSFRMRLRFCVAVNSVDVRTQRYSDRHSLSYASDVLAFVRSLLCMRTPLACMC